MRHTLLALAAVMAQGIAAQEHPQANETLHKSEVQQKGEAMLRTQEKHKNGDWYLGLGVGYSQCLAENAVAKDFIAHHLPSFNLMVGHNLSTTFGFLLTGALNMQSSRCNEALSSSLPEVYGEGRYKFSCWSAQLSGVFNMTNLFFGYDQERTVSWSMLAGAGVAGTFGFEKKVIDKWNLLTYYPVDGDGGIYPVGHIGTQMAVQAGKAWDLGLEVRMNVTDNAYNGVKNSNTIDFYLDAMLCATYHLKNGKQGMRRMVPPGRKVYIDPVLAECAVAHPETVAYGEAMNTVVPFYAGFYYLNDATMMRVEQVAQFMRKHPEVSLTIVGHPDVVPDDDALYHEHLAECRAEAVRKALVDNFGIDPAHLTTVASDEALQGYKAVREWVPSVSFVMRKSE